MFYCSTHTTRRLPIINKSNKNQQFSLLFHLILTPRGPYLEIYTITTKKWDLIFYFFGTVQRPPTNSVSEDTCFSPATIFSPIKPHLCTLPGYVDQLHTQLDILIWMFIHFSDQMTYWYIILFVFMYCVCWYFKPCRVLLINIF